MGRPTKCTPETTEKVCEALKLGVSWAAAAAHAGVPASAVAEWRRLGADGTAPFADFLAETDKARGVAEVRLAAMMMKAAQEGDTSAAKWLIEHRATDPSAVVDERPSAAAIIAKLCGA